MPRHPEARGIPVDHELRVAVPPTLPSQVAADLPPKALERKVLQKVCPPTPAGRARAFRLNDVQFDPVFAISRLDRASSV